MASVTVGYDRAVLSTPESSPRSSRTPPPTRKHHHSSLLSTPATRTHADLFQVWPATAVSLKFSCRSLGKQQTLPVCSQTHWQHSNGGDVLCSARRGRQTCRDFLCPLCYRQRDMLQISRYSADTDGLKHPDILPTAVVDKKMASNIQIFYPLLWYKDKDGLKHPDILPTAVVQRQRWP